jgi:hypothetical protein
VGNLDIGLHAIPRYISDALYDEIMEFISEDPSLSRFVRGQWFESEEREGFRRLADPLWASTNNANRMLAVFNDFGWTLEKTVEHNEYSGYVPEISFDFWSVTFEILIADHRMYVNVPIEKIQSTQQEVTLLPYNIEVLRFFGAGCVETEGFMLVPAGSGGVINFNNGKYREDRFSAPMYGTDPLLTWFFPQVEQPVRLPVLGIQNSGYGMVKHIQSGQALGFVNAEVAARTVGVGGTNAQNNAWFNFHLRSSMPLGMGGIPGAAFDLRVVQEEAYTGDLTVVYQFIAEENADVGDMAQAYQQFLVDEGILTPLSGPGDRTFYLDILGAIDVRQHILGVPYSTLEIMTDLEDAGRFVDMLNASGVNNIQMQLHGWFNRGINHDVAKRVNPIRGIGSPRDMRDLDARLHEAGGGLNPVVNFHMTNWYSRNFSSSLETARDPAGYVGFTAGNVARDLMITRNSIHWNDWFLFVHPGVVPQHVDRFIPAFERRIGLDNLALADMGSFLTESAHRRNPIDREHSRLVAEAQMGRLQEMAPNLVIFGGNDFSLQFASHVVDAPTEGDVYFIIDYAVPFFPMVLHGFIEFAGRPANTREDFHPTSVLLNSMATGASPRFMMSAQPTRFARFSPYESFYSTHYVNWMDQAIRQYQIYNDVYRHLRGERIVGFEVLVGRSNDTITGQQVTLTVFSNGTRIYVNNTGEWFEHGGVNIPPRWFTVTGGA